MVMIPWHLGHLTFLPASADFPRAFVPQLGQAKLRSVSSPDVVGGRSFWTSAAGVFGSGDLGPVPAASGLASGEATRCVVGSSLAISSTAVGSVPVASWPIWL